jgi:L-asparaginase
MSNTHKILLIATGGTIAGEVAKNIRDDQAIRTADDFPMIVKPTIDSLRKTWGIDVEIDPIDLKNQDGEIVKVDSSNIQPDHWKGLAALIKEKYDEYDSFIITHGTNTLGYTCAALSFAIANSNKPIVLTGSQVPSGMPGTDALTNLSNSMRVAVWPREKSNLKRIKGVIAVFGSHIITGTRVKKDTEFDYDAFKSFAVGSIGRIGRIIHINESNLERHLSYLTSNQYFAALKAEHLECVNEFDMNIASLTEFPGMSPKIFETLVEQNDVKAFILRSFGAGDASSNLVPAFEYLKGKEIPIVITTQAPNGNSNMQVNDPGQYLRTNKLAIPAFDMSIESQTTKLAWLLAKKKKREINYTQLCKEMITDIRGEINTMYEIGN